MKALALEFMTEVKDYGNVPNLESWNWLPASTQAQNLLKRLHAGKTPGTQRQTGFSGLDYGEGYQW